MKLWKNTLCYVLCCLALLAGTANASDTAKEKRWADQIVDGLIIGEPQWLQADGEKFLGIHAIQAGDKPRGAAIVMHGLGDVDLVKQCQKQIELFQPGQCDQRRGIGNDY